MAKKLKISVCITVLNEEGSIGALLDSLVNQTKEPDEIVVVDGGSNDNTISLLHKKTKKLKNLKIIETEKTSIAQGRNVGIKAAKGDVIVLTDAGCVPKRDWLEEITKAFEDKPVGIVAGFYGEDEKPQLVAGFYEMPYSNSFQEAARLYLGVPEERFNPRTFLPSARSVAFRKSVWEQVGKFSEKLEKGGEDTDFFYKCVKAGVKIIRSGEARVEWCDISNLTWTIFLKKIYVYAKGDGQAGIWWHPGKQLSSHNIKISFTYFRYILGLTFFVCGFIYPLIHLILLILLVLYLVWPAYKWRDVVKNIKTRLCLPFVQILADFAVMAGFLSGILTRQKA